MELYPHNRKAYDALARMLDERGRACVVQSTGTGKSFIGMEYVVEHPGERVLWVCPSDYIFAEQEAAFAREGMALPANLLRMTYQKLLADVKSGAPVPGGVGCVILDEFHRAGAPQWSDGVRALLEANPGCKVAGLTATPVRHCDKKDMAAELFDGNVASELGLAEAWLLGILPKPVYVTSLFSLDEEFDRMLADIDRIPDDDKRAEVLKKYNDMRESLSAAGGVPGIFAKHLKKPDAKVVVFCPDRKEMDAMRRRAADWFSLVNPEVHAYRVFCANPTGEEELARFKADESGALKVLYCIDQLNEGVHVKGIDAIVMARPTSSPIIFLQQLGRCLDAAGATVGKEPVVFDLSNNIFGLGKSASWLFGGIREAQQKLDGEGASPRFSLGDFDVFDEMQLLADVQALIDEAVDGWKNVSHSEMLDFLEANR